MERKHICIAIGFVLAVAAGRHGGRTADVGSRSPCGLGRHLGGAAVTWDWIADTLQMIESDLRERERLVERRVQRDVAEARSNVRRAKDDIVRAIEKLQTARAPESRPVSASVIPEEF